MPTCEACQQENPEIARFCLGCGRHLVVEPEHDERRIVTVIFVDIVGFTSAAERLDPEDVRALVVPYYERVRAEIESFGGLVEKFIGDAVMGVFGIPTAFGDDPERAVRAALGIQRWVNDPSSNSAGLSVRIAVNTGDALVALGARAEFGEAMVSGDVVNTTSRMQQAAPVNGILVGADTYAASRHVITYEPSPPITAKGKAEPVEVWVAVAATGDPGERPMNASSFVGRGRELRLLQWAWTRAAEDKAAQLVTVFGAPGVGKTRLGLEFARYVADSGGRTVRGRSLPYQESSAYAAFAAQVKQIAEILESDSTEVAISKLHGVAARLIGEAEVPAVTDHLSVLLGISTDRVVADRESLFFSARCFVEAVARERPTLLVFEDIHWADQNLLDLIELLAAQLHDVPILILALARPELLDARSGWAGGMLSHIAVPLDPLDPEAARDLAATLLGPARRDAPDGSDDLLAVAAGLAETSEGNPLFIEQLAAAVSERSTGEEALPTTIRGIVAARLDALPANERTVLLAASVVGRAFWRGAVARMVSADILQPALTALESRDLIRREAASIIKDEQQYVFKHVLICDAAYETLSRRNRQDMHAEVAAFLEQTLSLEGESAARLARHWRAAGQGERAIDYLVAAAEQASRGWAKAHAFELYGEALKCAPLDNADLIRMLQQRQALAWQALMHIPDARQLRQVRPDPG